MTDADFALVPQIFGDEPMAEPGHFDVAGGQAVVFSAGSPMHERENQDAAFVCALDAERAVLAVADGVGGLPGGGSASRLALRCVSDAIEAARPGSETLRSGILDGLEAANRAVLELGIGAATTVAVAEIGGRELRSYHVGDSGILVVGGRGRIKLQTIAHSPVGYALESGLLDEDEALHHDERHVVSNLVGSEDMRIEIGSPLPLAPKDTVLLASDGLFDNLTTPELVEQIRSRPLEFVAKALVEGCHARMCEPREGEPSKPDDLSFVLYRPGETAKTAASQGPEG